MEKINWSGCYSLTIREIKRFISVYNQTILTPAISALIFLAVFTLAIGTHRHEINNIKFIDFTGYGLIAMSIIQHAFANSSSSFIMSKILGYITDILTAPLGSIEIIMAFTIGSILRGLIVGLAVSITLSPFISYTIYHPLLLILYLLISTALLGQIGILCGLIANSFDQHAAITSYLITPLSFLSGTFYSVNDLPLFFKQINFVNPFFYIIDGLRYCMTNQNDSHITVGIIFLLISNIIVFLILDKALKNGWRIKT